MEGMILGNRINELKTKSFKYYFIYKYNLEYKLWIAPPPSLIKISSHFFFLFVKKKKD